MAVKLAIIIDRFFCRVHYHFRLKMGYMNDNPDTRLLIAGDRKILKKLFDQYSREMYFFAMGLVNDHLIAEDAIQESFIYLWEHRKQLDSRYAIGGYLRQSVRNYILNYFRHQRVQIEHEQEIIREQRNLYDVETDFSEIISRIRLVIDSLPENCRKVFIAAVIEGKGYIQTADEMHISVNTVKTQVRLAYKKIRLSMTDYAGEVPLCMVIYIMISL